MAMTTYKITSKHGSTKPPRLICAPTKHQAMSFAASTEFSVSVPSGVEMYELGKQGVEIENISTATSTATE